MNNIINLVLTPEERTAVLTAIETINTTLMDKLITLTKEERIEIAKMGDKTTAFVTKSLEYAKQYPDLVPPYVPVADFEIDLNAVIALREFIQLLAPINEALDDSELQSGSEAYQAALIFYNAVKLASHNNVPGAKAVYDDLRQRFPGRSKKQASI